MKSLEAIFLQCEKLVSDLQERMSTWQIFSDAENNFRWEPTAGVIPSKPQHDQNRAPVQPQDSSCRFPSMVDLLLQGCTKHLEDADDGNVGNSPIFRTGSGKSVELKQSSLAKALSVLGGDDSNCGTINKGAEDARENPCDLPNSLFHTGFGRKVNISSAGLLKAKKLLGLEEGDLQEKYEGFEQVRTSSITNKHYGWQNFSHLEASKDTNSTGIGSKSVSRPSINSTAGFMRRLSENEFDVNSMQSNTHDKSTKPPPIKFQTAGGRTLSVSNDALQRARSLLGDPEVGNLLNEGDPNDPSLLFNERKTLDGTSSNKENEFCTPFNHGTAREKHISGVFTSPLRLSSKRGRSLIASENLISRSNLINKFDEADHRSFCKLDSNASTVQKPLSNRICAPNTLINDSRESCNGFKMNQGGSLSGCPLVDISNRVGTAQIRSEKKRFGIRSSISPFKRPRSSKFSTPSKKDDLYVSSKGLSTSSSEISCRKILVSTKYPFRAPRKSIKEYFEVPVLNQSMLEHCPEKIRWIKANNSSEYLFFDESGLNGIGAESFLRMLAQTGASMQHVSKEWFVNHYKWIVWKLACYERYRPDNSAVKFLSVPNILEELKYRYEREVNYGHRSAIKRILDGDALPSSMMVLCVSAIYANNEHTIEAHPVAFSGAENIVGAKVELTDGWYSIDALLDMPLSKQLAARKLFVGQKLRLWGAGLYGWAGPVSPLEASKTASLSLHINGTYRAHWADRLGFCKCVAAPLAFRCIKSNGGPVPCTLVGVTRIYPVLFKEKLSNGGSIVRSENMETKMVQLNNQRRSTVVEGVLSEFQRENRSSHINNNSDGEGARIFEMLETAAEPDVLMAEMSSEQLSLLASYQAKLEVTRQLDIEKSINKALEDAGLGEREVTPFVRVRVVGLTSRTYQGKSSSKEGLITMWNPTEKQLKDLVEGQVYVVAGLVPVHSKSDVLYLHGRGSTTWRPLSALRSQQFEPFFNPRKSVLLSNFGEVPFSSEFDIAALVVHVGEVYMTANQKKQWVFVTDASISEIISEGLLNSLLAICFCSPCIDEDSVAPINSNLVGSTVGFHNLIKREKDQRNHVWVAEATENSTYSFNFGTPSDSHLKIAAASAQTWAKKSNSIINKLKEKVISIIGD